MTWDLAWDFRSTLGFVTDPSYGVIASGNVAYPTLFTAANGDSINAGWTTTGGQLNQDASVDPRLAGIAYAGPGASIVWQADLSSGNAPGPGTYTIDLAIGDAASARDYAAVLLKDNTTTLISFSGSVATRHFFDATGVDRNPGTASWDLVRATVNKTFATSTVILSVTDPSSYTCIAHFRLTFVPAGGSVPVLMAQYRQRRG